MFGTFVYSSSLTLIFPFFSATTPAASRPHPSVTAYLPIAKITVS
jgi:hypothetical protein